MQAYSRSAIFRAYLGDRLFLAKLNLGSGRQRFWNRVDAFPQRYGYKNLVLPEYRGMRLNSSLRRYSDAYFVEQGIQRSIAYMDVHNLSSFAAHVSDPDRRHIGYAGYVSWGKRYWTFRTEQVRKALSFEQRAT